VRQLSSSSGKAIASAAIFIERILERFLAESVAVEVIPDAREFQRLQIFRAITDDVIKLYSTLEFDGQRQVAFYHPGIGTMEPFGSLSTLVRKFTRLLGMVFGYGLENDIRDAYVFLIRTYCPGDSVYLFGFSRGAFTVHQLRTYSPKPIAMAAPLATAALQEPIQVDGGLITW
jgi:Uncharacterized alpha/beta hydrolase domain (DUF2235)